MSYLSIFLIGLISGLGLNILLTKFSRKRKLEGEFLVTKEDIEKISKEIGELKAMHLEQKESSDLARAEKEFYDSIAGEGEDA